MMNDKRKNWHLQCRSFSRVVGPRTTQDQSLFLPFCSPKYTYVRGQNVSSTLWLILLNILCHHTLSQLYSPKRQQLPNVPPEFCYLFLGCSSKNHFQDYPQQMKLQFRKKKSYLFQKRGSMFQFPSQKFTP